MIQQQRNGTPTGSRAAVGRKFRGGNGRRFWEAQTQHGNPNMKGANAASTWNVVRRPVNAALSRRTAVPSLQHSDSDSTRAETESGSQSEPGSPASDCLPHPEPCLDDLPSQGSALHVTGNCHPCAWFWKSVMCRKAQECHYCHLCPNGELKRRRKAKEALMRTRSHFEQIRPVQVEVKWKRQFAAKLPESCRMTVKKTFVHIETNGFEEVPDQHQDELLVLSTGLLFSSSGGEALQNF